MFMFVMLHITYIISHTSIHRHTDPRRWPGRSRPPCSGGHILVAACSGWSGCISCLSSTESHRNDPACCWGAHTPLHLITQERTHTNLNRMLYHRCPPNPITVFIFLAAWYRAELIILMISCRGHTQTHTERPKHTPFVSWYEAKCGLICCSNAFSWAGEECVWARCADTKSFVVCTSGRVMIGCRSMLAGEERKCVCVCVSSISLQLITTQVSLVRTMTIFSPWLSKQ